MIRELLSDSDNISSNRSITITVFVFMLLVMILSLFMEIKADTLQIVLEYSFYIFVASISLKSVEKVTDRIKK